MEKNYNKITVDINKPYARLYFSEGIEEIFKLCYSSEYSEIIILGIGTDRSTGDSLGPLVGHKLKSIRCAKVHVYGTLEEPVHAKNLIENLNNIQNLYKNPFIIAIDACLGKPDRVGCISIGTGPLRPGAGVNKELPTVGNIHIMGNVNIGGFMEYLILQNTRLSLVMRMADTISNGLYRLLWKLHKGEIEAPLMTETEALLDEMLKEKDPFNERI